LERAIVTLVGIDRAGIIAAVCTYFADNQVNILDIKQTTVQEYINMMMIVDLDKCKKPFPTIASELNDVGTIVKCTITIQKEEIFNMMHRI